MPWASFARWLPIWPTPTMPRVLLYSSTPMNRSFSHLAPFIEAVACGILRASARINARVCSAVVTVLPPGVFITTMPRLVAAAVSTLSRPDPARPMTRSLPAADHVGRHLGRAADDQPVVVLDLA